MRASTVACCLCLLVPATASSAGKKGTRFCNPTGETLSDVALAPAGTRDGGIDRCADDKDGTGQIFASNDAEATVIDVESGAVVQHHSMDDEPEGALATPDGRHVFVAPEVANLVSAIEVASKKALKEVVTYHVYMLPGLVGMVGSAVLARAGLRPRGRHAAPAADGPAPPPWARWACSSPSAPGAWETPPAP